MVCPIWTLVYDDVGLGNFIYGACVGHFGVFILALKGAVVFILAR